MENKTNQATKRQSPPPRDKTYKAGGGFADRLDRLGDLLELPAQEAEFLVAGAVGGGACTVALQVQRRGLAVGGLWSRLDLTQS